jgi:hypothetical protein
MALGALSIDLDALRHYRRIHGTAEETRSGAEADPVYTRAVERFGELCTRLQARGTAFCVGEDLAHPAAASAIRILAGGGHEIGNHTWSHDYALTRRDAATVTLEVRRGAEAVAAACGRRPAGFRAPGYALTAPLLAAAAAEGHRYDSSAFPAAPYWLAKAGVLAALALAGRPSGAVLDRPRALLAPRSPYRPRADEPYARGDAAILELPVTTGLLGFPLIGTFVATLPAAALRVLASGTGRLPLFNLELHGVDFLDPGEVPPELRARRRDLRLPASLKMERIEAFARSLGREWVTLAEAADRLAPAHP